MARRATVSLVMTQLLDQQSTQIAHRSRVFSPLMRAQMLAQRGAIGKRQRTVTPVAADVQFGDGLYFRACRSRPCRSIGPGNRSHLRTVARAQIKPALRQVFLFGGSEINDRGVGVGGYRFRGFTFAPRRLRSGRTRFHRLSSRDRGP